MAASLRFIPPCLPSIAKAPPAGADWLHQPKLDGYRLQAVKEGRTVRLYTKGGHDWSERLTALADSLRAIPARSAIIDGELVMVDASGLPSFLKLHLRRGKRAAGLHLFAFDLLHMNGREVCAEPLVARQGRLATLLARSSVPVLHPVTSFEDGAALLAAAEEHGLEGIVSKRADLPYRSGKARSWLKIRVAATGR